MRKMSSDALRTLYIAFNVAINEVGVKQNTKTWDLFVFRDSTRADEQTDKNVIDYAAIFTYYLFESWRLPTTCESESDKIVIFYSKNDGVLYMYAGENLREKLPKEVIRRTAVESKAAFGSGIYEGMKYLLKRFE
ncbi:hypothetical protein ACTXT7_014559 [Hymenolepis weldensis]